MLSSRRTAILQITAPGADASATYALDKERTYETRLRLDGRDRPCRPFRTPLGDDARHRFDEALERATSSTDEQQSARRDLEQVRNHGQPLLEAVQGLSEALRDFLADERELRRLVIASDRPEIHQIPWESLFAAHALNGQETLSLVHCWIREGAPEFTDEGLPPALPALAEPKLVVACVSGPETQRRALHALWGIRAGRRELERGVDVHSLEATASTRVLVERLGALAPHVVSIEAHGNVESGGTAVAEGSRGDTPEAADVDLAASVGARSLVFLWSCHSAYIRPNGSSVGQALHRGGADLVVAFRSPLRHSSCGEIAREVFDKILDWGRPVDAETAVCRVRRSWLHTRLSRCDWASMVVWMRRPVDLAPWRPAGPRLPSSAWSDDGELDAPVAAFFEALEHGRLRDRADNLPDELPVRAVGRFRGYAVRLDRSLVSRGDPSQPVLPAEVERCLQEPTGDHPGERLVGLLDALDRAGDSVLVWSRPGDRERRLLEELYPLPARVALAVSGPRDEARRDDTSVHPALRALDLIEAGEYAEAALVYEGAQQDSGSWASDDRVRFEVAGYEAYVKSRSGREDQARECLDRLAKLDAFEGSMARGNFEHRRGEGDLARRFYEDAEAGAGGSAVRRARARHQRGYLDYEWGEHASARRLYDDALGALREAGAARRQAFRGDWTLGCCLRDYAALLARMGAQDVEAERMLRQATAIHALDGRWSQAGWVLETRADLASRRERPAEAERDRLAASRLFHAAGNWVAWAQTVRKLAAAARAAGRAANARSLLENALQRLPHSDTKRVDRGQLALELAELEWDEGRFVESRESCQVAIDCLSGRPRELERARLLFDNLSNLLPGDDPAGGP